MNKKIDIFKAGSGIISAMIVMSSAMLIHAKDNKGVIMTVDGEEVPTEEFIYLYQKNNQQQTQPQSIDEYLQLFEVYRLKVAEAKQEGMDTTASFQKEMSQYRRELVEPYIADTAYISTLVDIAAEREKNEVESSHIMIIRTNDAQKDARNLVLLDSLRQELLNGADFIEMAKKYSQDRFSSDKGGYLGFTPAGTFPYGFETAVYETPEGEISEIVESHVGWHIVKSGARRPAMDLNKSVKPLDVIRAEVLRKSSSPFDSRFHELRKRQIEQLKNKHKENNLNLENLSEDEIYDVLLIEEEKAQYNNNPEYRNLVDEYTNGSLLYEVSVRNVWDKAANDTEGLENYFNLNRDKYKWDSPHAKGILIQVINDSIENVIRTQVASMPQDSVVNYIRKNFKKQATADRFNVAQGVNGMIDHLMFGVEPSQPSLKNFDGYFVVNSRIVEQPEELNDVKSAVIADYQEALEEDWVSGLKRRHNVRINDKEIKRLKKQFNEK